MTTSPGVTTSGPIRILVVEDHADTLETYRLLLRRLGCDAETAPDCATAHAATQDATLRVDLALIDIGLPDGDGVDLARTLKKRCNCTTALLTGYSMDADLDRYHAAGVDHVLVKPLGVDQIRDIIAAVQARRNPPI